MAGTRGGDSAVSGVGRCFGIVAARFHQELVDRLLAGATDCLRQHGVGEGDLSVARVPGAWEIPVALGWMAASGRFDALIALGLVLRGETPHFDYICRECSRGVAAVAARHALPVAFGVLTCNTREQATARSAAGEGNKGREAALAALEMADLRRRLAEAG